MPTTFFVLQPKLLWDGCDLNPTTALARQLQSRNHDVVLISLPNAEPYVRAAGLAFLPYCENAFSAGSGNEIRRRLSKLQGEDSVRFIIEALGVMMEAVLSSLPAALATPGPKPSCSILINFMSN